MTTLSINDGHSNAAACLYEDGQVTDAATAHASGVRVVDFGPRLTDERPCRAGWSLQGGTA